MKKLLSILLITLTVHYANTLGLCTFSTANLFEEVTVVPVGWQHALVATILPFEVINICNLEYENDIDATEKKEESFPFSTEGNYYGYPSVVDCFSQIIPLFFDLPPPLL